MRAKHLHQRTERRGRSFLLDQKRRINRARRIIQSHNQIERRLARQPHMHRAVLMQHHARKRTPLALAPMSPATLRFLQQTFRVKEGLRPRIAPAKIVLLHQMLMKMLGRETRVTRAIQRLHLFAPIRRNPLARGLTQPPIKQASFALILKTLTPAPERPLANPQ